MNRNDLLVFEEKNPELQEEFLKSKGYDTSNIETDLKIISLLESNEYWDFVRDEFINMMANKQERQTTLDEFGI